MHIQYLYFTVICDKSKNLVTCHKNNVSTVNNKIRKNSVNVSNYHRYTFLFPLQPLQITLYTSMSKITIYAETRSESDRDRRSILTLIGSDDSGHASFFVRRRPAGEPTRSTRPDGHRTNTETRRTRPQPVRSPVTQPGPRTHVHSHCVRSQRR